MPKPDLTPDPRQGTLFARQSPENGSQRVERATSGIVRADREIVRRYYREWIELCRSIEWIPKEERPY